MSVILQHVFRVGRPLFGHAVQIETGCFEISEVFLEVVLKTRVHKDPGIAAADQVDGFNAVGAVDTGQGIPDPAAQPKPVSQVRSNGFGIAHIGRKGPRAILFLGRKNRAQARGCRRGGGCLEKVSAMNEVLCR